MASKHFSILINFLLVFSICGMQSTENLMILVNESCKRNKLKEPLAMLWRDKYWCNFETCLKSYGKKHNCARHIMEQHPHCWPLIKKYKCKTRSCAFWYLNDADEQRHYQEYQKIHPHPE
jgi:hypothetical protein